MKNITIVGAGLAGSLLSIYLAKRGHNVSVYERRPDMRLANISAGRSINLALSDRGWRGLERAGLASEIEKIIIPMPGRMMHATDGTLTFQPYGKNGQAINSISRGLLNKTLMNAAEQYPNVSYHFNQRAVDCDLNTTTMTFENSETNVKSVVQSDVIFAADGAFSLIRDKMQKTDRFNYSQEYLEHGYKELVIPPGPNGEFMIEKNALHIWARKSFMMIALPNTDATYTCTLFLPFISTADTPGFDQLNTKEDVMNFFNTYFPDAVPLMPTLLEDFFANPTSSLATVRTYPWVRGNVALIGDAAHAICPFFGQGMICSFEDCVVLDECVERHGDNWQAALDEYQQLRKPNGDAIAQLALDNFIEMRDKVADPQFLLRKKIEAEMHKRFPELYTPLYTLVVFTPDVTYAEAYKRGKQNDALMEKILALPNIENTWNTNEVMNTIKEMLQV